MSTENKQFVAVSIFLLIVVLSIAFLATDNISKKKTKDYTITPVVVNSNENVPEVENSKPVEVITQNNSYSSNSSKKSSSSTNNNSYSKATTNNNTTKSSTKSSTKKTSSSSTTTKSSSGSVPVSYFITEVDNDRVYVGGTTNIHVTIKPNNATNKRVTYASSNSSIAMVTEYGKIIGINPGKCKITINVLGAGTSSFEFLVIKQPTNSNPTSKSNSNSNTRVRVSGVSLNKTAVTVNSGTSTQLSATVAPSNATNKGVTWTSSNTSVATVTSTGLVTGKNAGTAVITVKTNDGSKTATCTIYVSKIDNRVRVTGVKLNKTNINLGEGVSSQLSATVIPTNATNKGVTWTSSNNSVATVTSTGVVTGKKAGTAVITVKTNDNSKTATCKVTVVKTNNTIRVTGVSLNKTSLSLKENTSSNLSASITPTNATNKTVTWTSSNTSIATVSSTGTVTAKKAGLATITVRTNDNSKTATCVVTVIPSTVRVTGVSLNKTSLNIKENTSSNLVASVTPTNATNKGVTWSSNNTSVATVSSNGTVTGKKTGTATITVKTNDGSKTATCKVTVTAATIRVTGVKLNRSTLSLKEGGTSVLTATVSPTNAANKGVTWSSSNTKVATVSSAGKITAKKAGTATITVKTNDNSKTATCKVTVEAIKNGWYTEGGKKYYYKKGTKLKNQFVDYIYLNSSGAAIDKMGSFEITVYKSTAWVAVEPLNIREKANSNSKKLGQVPVGSKVTLLSSDTNGYIKMKYGNTVGYILANEIFINLPDIMPGLAYDIQSASKTGATSTVGGKKIPGVTGVKLYKFSKKMNSKINRSEYYAPLLYPVAKKLQKAYTAAKKQGYSFKIYDTYRPRPVEEYVYNKYMNLYNKDAAVRAAVNRTVGGYTYSLGWFMTTGASKHCQGIAIDMGLMKNGKDLKAQTPVDVLDASAVVELNNTNSNKLRSIMTNAGFFSLKSEWWHFDDRNNSNYYYNPYASFYIYD